MRYNTRMSKSRSTFICQQCGYHSSTYLGKCPQCDSWNSFVETIEDSDTRGSLTGKRATIVNLKDVQKQHYKRISTNIGEFDRCLGGGIVAGSLVLVAGDPGVGKSTLLLQLALSINQKLDVRSEKLDKEVRDSKLENQISNIQSQNPASNLQHPTSNVLYVAGEESAQQIKIRAERINPKAALDILSEVDIDVICNTLEQAKPALVIVDSIQTMETEDLSGIAGSVGQVRECAQRLQRVAKAFNIPIFLVGHVTKEGSIAGPKTLEHLVDVVLSLEGDQSTNFRVLRASKNRFGPTDEVGIFEMEERGMSEVKNPSALFIDQKVESAGSAVVVTMTGVRPLLVEIQALTTKSFSPMPRRVAAGVDNQRLQLLVAVLQRRMGLPLYDQDVFVNVTGGLRLTEPAVDLGIAMAIISSIKDKIITQKIAFVGEVGLLGELRGVRFLERREKEAKKLGFTKIISSQNARSLLQAVKLSGI